MICEYVDWERKLPWPCDSEATKLLSTKIYRKTRQGVHLNLCDKHGIKVGKQMDLKMRKRRKQ